ncbi:MAG: cyclase [Patiriisocius sp.]|jgi:cyclase
MKPLLLIFLATISFYSQAAEDRWAKIEIKVIPVTDTIYMLEGAGGNIGVSYGASGMLMIDDQFEPLAGKIKAALKTIGDEAPTYLLNTHYHGDHTGGNGQFGSNSIIMAHQNVRVRLLDGDTQSNYPAQALPVITYSENASLYFNGEEIHMTHTPSGHTDGDSMVHFKTSNVVHMGDNFFNGRFPYVDRGAGGSVQGLISSVESMLTLMDDKTRVIPGHGSLGNMADLKDYLDMLKATSDAVKLMIADGKSEQTILDTGFDEKWDSWGTGFINQERWIKTLYATYQ